MNDWTALTIVILGVFLLIAFLVWVVEYYADAKEKIITNRLIKMAELGYDQVSEYGLNQPVWQKKEE